MIRRRHVWFLPLIAFSWLALAATASAGCVWVLWGVLSEQEVTVGKKPWAMCDAKGFYDTKEECYQAEKNWHGGEVKGTKTKL
jgi:hypothetical protein